MNEEPLKPCPFCGGEAYHPVIKGVKRSEVWCKGCEVEMFGGDDDIPTAAENWNARSQPA